MDERLVELIKTASGGTVEITPDTNLALDLGLKSIDLLELVTDVEDTFGIEVSDDAVENIHTAGELDAYIKEMTE
jgi:acyl carrier protein